MMIHMPATSKSKSKKKVALVTGATSGIGRVLVKDLLDAGYEVRVTLREHPSKSQEWKKLPPKVKPYKVNILLKDEKDKKELELACTDVDYLFHIAGRSYNEGYSYRNLIDTNVLATENILSTYVRTNPGKKIHFLYASSVTVYGYRRAGETLTEDSELKPSSKYSESKVLGEQVVRAFSNANKNLKYTIFRFGTFYGGDYKDHFFKIFTLIREGKMVYTGKGVNKLTLINVEDAARSMEMAVDDVRSDTYNVIENPSPTLKELAELTALLLKVNVPRAKVPYRVGQLTRKIINVSTDEFKFITSNRAVSTERISKNLGFKCKHKINVDGKEMIKEYMDMVSKPRTRSKA